ncbi:hypothetical protein ALC57_07143 [Trachymyrmex cornetzi]|uniref:Uncharacterized protein n=1 Tax=Trachymyrmex cornetzi TaxID=471704 RepID=A0A195E5W0_9HYME|nr:hypothetical protein ALC57_07143 [Trachymyrmex cornetzi]
MMCLTSSIRRLLYLLRDVNAPVDLCSHLQIDGDRPIAHPHFGRASGGRIVTIYVTMKTTMMMPMMPTMTNSYSVALRCISPSNADFISSLATTRGATVAGSPYDRIPSCTAILVNTLSKSPLFPLVNDEPSMPFEDGEFG